MEAVDDEILYRFQSPTECLKLFVNGFWMLANKKKQDKEVVVLPDGRIDLFFSHSDKEPYHVLLLGLTSKPELAAILSGTQTFAVSFTPLGAEYLLEEEVAGLVDTVMDLPADFWGLTDTVLDHFDTFCQTLTQILENRIPENPDSRKQALFHLLEITAGNIPVQDLGEQLHWNPRQINRYFNKQFGVPVKSYASILRFRSTFNQIREGKLYPEQHFSDQSHFIREIRKLSGVSPKELYKNKNDRFIQFSTLDEH